LLLYKRKCGAGGVAQVIESLPSKCEALSSNPITSKKKKREKKKNSSKKKVLIDCLFVDFGSYRLLVV
jgi:hypothetical protein